MSDRIVRLNVPDAFPFLSQVVISKGTVYVSGSIGVDSDNKLVGGVDLQTWAALENMKKILEEAGSSVERILKVNVYLSNMARDFREFNSVYARFFSNPEALPARTCIGVAALPLGAFVEIECIADAGPGHRHHDNKT